MDFQVFVTNEPGNVTINKVILPSGEAIIPFEGVIDITPMKRFPYFNFVLHTNAGSIKHKKQECLFFGLKKGKDGFDAMHYEVVKDLPLK